MDEREKKDRKPEEIRTANGSQTSEQLREAHLILQELYRIVGAATIAPPVPTPPVVLPMVPTSGFAGWTQGTPYYGNF